MEDPKLNRMIDEIRELHTRWGQFHEFFKMALKAERISPEAEAKFLDLKTRIAMLHDGFMQALKTDQKIGQGVLAIISACIMLRRIPLMSTAEAQKLELDWNEIYLLMTETIANLEDEREHLASVNATTYKIQQFKMHLRAKVAAVMQSGYFKLGLVLFVIGFIIFGVPAFGIYEWSKLKYDVPILAPVVNKGIQVSRLMGFEVPYDNINEVPSNIVESKDDGDFNVDSAKRSRDFFISQLYSYGFGDTDIQKAKAAVESTTEWFVVGRQNFITQQNMIVYTMLFKTTGEAERFVQLRKLALGRRSQGDQDKIKNSVNVCRVSNFVIFAISENQRLREDYVKQRWGLTSTQMGL